jgi:hypothetical protein
MAMFYMLFVRKKIFHPKLRDGFPEKFLSRKNFCLPPPPPQHFWGKYGKNMEELEKYGTVVILARML